jgi:hypothetical protein
LPPECPVPIDCIFIIEDGYADGWMSDLDFAIIMWCLPIAGIVLFCLYSARQKIRREWRSQDRPTDEEHFDNLDKGIKVYGWSVSPGAAFGSALLIVVLFSFGMYASLEGFDETDRLGDPQGILIGGFWVIMGIWIAICIGKEIYFFEDGAASVSKMMGNVFIKWGEIEKVEILWSTSKHPKRIGLILKSGGFSIPIEKSSGESWRFVDYIEGWVPVERWSPQKEVVDMMQEMLQNKKE